MGLTKGIFKKHWRKETSISDKWSKGNSSLGQCAISSIAFQDIFGGEIGKIKITIHIFLL